MKLYCLRHAIALERGSPGYKDDSLRPLTPEGKRKMRAIAAGLKAIELAIDQIIVSPYLRAKETADIIIGTFNIADKQIMYCNDLVPEADLTDTLGALHKLAKTEHVMIVGHEPHLSSLISLLTTGNTAANIDLKKGGCACLNVTAFKPGTAVLEWLITPALAAVLGK